MKHLLILLTLVGCGFNGNQRVTAQGETKHRVELDLLFIEQIKELCDTIHQLDKTASAQCVIDNITVLNVNLDTTLSTVCPTENLPVILKELCEASSL